MLSFDVCGNSNTFNIITGSNSSNINLDTDDTNFNCNSLTWNNLEHLKLLKKIDIPKFQANNCGYPNETEEKIFFTGNVGDAGIIAAIDKKTLSVVWTMNSLQIFESSIAGDIFTPDADFPISDPSGFENYGIRYSPAVSENQKRLFTVITYKPVGKPNNTVNYLFVLDSSNGQVIEKPFKFLNKYSAYGEGWTWDPSLVTQRITTKLSTQPNLVEINGVTKLICGFRSTAEYGAGIGWSGGTEESRGVDDMNDIGLIGGIICLEKDYTKSNSSWSKKWHSLTTPAPLRGFGINKPDPNSAYYMNNQSALQSDQNLYELWKSRCNFTSRTINTLIDYSGPTTFTGPGTNALEGYMGPYYKPDDVGYNSAKKADKLSLDSYVLARDPLTNDIISDSSYQDLFMYITMYDGYKLTQYIPGLGYPNNNNQAQHVGSTILQYLVKGNSLALSTNKAARVDATNLVYLDMPFYIQSRNVLTYGGKHPELFDINVSTVEGADYPITTLTCKYLDPNLNTNTMTVVTTGINNNDIHITNNYDNTIGAPATPYSRSTSGYLIDITRLFTDNSGCYLQAETTIDSSNNTNVTFINVRDNTPFTIPSRMLVFQDILKSLPVALAENGNYYLDAAEAYRLNYYGNSVWSPKLIFDKRDNTVVVNVGNGNGMPLHELQNYYRIGSGPDHECNKDSSGNGKWFAYTDYLNNNDGTKYRNDDFSDLAENAPNPPLMTGARSKGINTNQIVDWKVLPNCYLPTIGARNVCFMQDSSGLYTHLEISEYIQRYRDAYNERVNNIHKYVSKRGLRSLTNSVGAFDLDTGNLVWRSASTDHGDHYWRIWWQRNLLSAFGGELRFSYEKPHFYIDRSITLQEISKVPTTPDNDISIPAYNSINGYIYATNKGGNVIKINPTIPNYSFNLQSTVGTTQNQYPTEIKKTTYVETSFWSQDVDQGDQNYQWGHTNTAVVTRHSGNNQLGSYHVKYNKRGQLVEQFPFNNGFLSLVNTTNRVNDNGDVYNVDIRHPDPSLSLPGYGGSTAFIDSDTGGTIAMIHDSYGYLVFVNADKVFNENNLNNNVKKFYGTKATFGRCPATVSDNKIYVQASPQTGSGMSAYIGEIAGINHITEGFKVDASGEFELDDDGEKIPLYPFDGPPGIWVYGIDSSIQNTPANYYGKLGYSYINENISIND